MGRAFLSQAHLLHPFYLGSSPGSGPTAPQGSCHQLPHLRTRPTRAQRGAVGGGCHTAPPRSGAPFVSGSPQDYPEVRESRSQTGDRSFPHSLPRLLRLTPGEPVGRSGERLWAGDAKERGPGRRVWGIPGPRLNPRVGRWAVRGGLRGDTESHLGTGTPDVTSQKPLHLRLPNCDMGLLRSAHWLASIMYLLCQRLGLGQTLLARA